MKRKDLIKEIEKKALNDFNDIEININNIEIDEPVYKRNSFSLKRGLVMSFSVIFIFITGFFIYSLNIGNTFSDVTPLNSETEILGFQTVSSAALLSSYEVTNVNYSNSVIVFEQLNQNPFDITNELNIIADYMNLAETMFGSSNNYIYKEIESNNIDYDYAFEYKGMDLAGNLIEYTGYYNNTTDNLGNELSQGILVSNQRTYHFTNQINDTLSKYTVYTNQNNYVEVINVSTEDSQSFKYKIFKGNQLFNSSVITLRQFQNDFEADIMITHTNDKQLELTVTNQNDFEGFNVRYNYNSKQTGSFKVFLVYDDESEMYKYQFQFEERTIIANRKEKGNKPATNDDFINGPGNNNQPANTTNNPGNRRSKIKTDNIETYLI